jgi:hypothetical protein
MPWLIRASLQIGESDFATLPEHGAHVTRAEPL